MRLIWGCAFAALFVGADCGSETTAGPPDADAAFGDTDALPKNSDAGSDEANAATPTQPALLIVDGIGTSTFELTNASIGQYQDVRVCVFNGTTALTQYALPDDRVMPLTNYAGVARGRGLDLGSFATSGAVNIAVFNASDLANDAVWASSRAGNDCTSITCDTTFPCRPHAMFPVTLTNDITILALGDDTASGHVKLTAVGFEDNPFSGAEGQLWGTVANLAGWESALKVGAFYGDQGSTNTTIADPLTPNTAAKPGFIATLSTYETLGVSFVAESGQQPFDHFTQSLDSIAYVSNPDVDPITFFDVRDNYVFALIGDPNDPTSVNLNGGRNAQFNGVGLHIIAVPYATPHPLH